MAGFKSRWVNSWRSLQPIPKRQASQRLSGKSQASFITSETPFFMTVRKVHISQMKLNFMEAESEKLETVRRLRREIMELNDHMAKASGTVRKCKMEARLRDVEISELILSEKA